MLTINVNNAEDAEFACEITEMPKLVEQLMTEFDNKQFHTLSDFMIKLGQWFAAQKDLSIVYVPALNRDGSEIIALYQWECFEMIFVGLSIMEYKSHANAQDATVYLFFEPEPSEDD